jgi:hypothetical protein
VTEREPKVLAGGFDPRTLHPTWLGPAVRWRVMAHAGQGGSKSRLRSAWQGDARLCKAWPARVAARQCKVGHGGSRRGSDRRQCTWRGADRPVRAKHGNAPQGEAWQADSPPGCARHGDAWLGLSGPDAAVRGEAMRGSSRLVSPWLGQAEQGMVSKLRSARGKAWLGTVWPRCTGLGKTPRGEPWLGHAGFGRAPPGTSWLGIGRVGGAREVVVA